MTKQIEHEAPPTTSTDDAPQSARAVLDRRIKRNAIELTAARSEMETLAHSISHDLRSPLAVIAGFADLLSRHSGERLDAKGRRYLERITSAASRIGQMMDEILALSRMSQSEMHCVNVDLGVLVNRMIADLDASKGARRIIWLVGTLPAVRADPTLIRRAITGLVSNALAFTQSREVARIQIGARDGDGESILFVRDNGTGFSVKQRERMFSSPQPSRSTSPFDGSAVGLPYVQRIIQRHGGRTWTERVPDGGATFYFSLPDHGDGRDFPQEKG